MKKILAFILTITIVFSATTVAFAAENSVYETYSTASTYAMVSDSDVMIGSTPIYDVPLNNVGPNPTFKFSISGNPNLYVDVKLVSPIGNTFTIFDNVRCDGTVHSKSHFSLISGTYRYSITVNHGSSAGQRKDYTISAEW